MSNYTGGLDNAERHILRLLHDAKKPYSTKELAIQFRKSSDIELSEETVRATVWDLIGRSMIVLDRDWKLRLHEVEAHSTNSPVG